MKTLALSPTRWVWILLVAAVLAVAGGYLAYQLSAEPNVVLLDLFTDVADDRRRAGIANNVFIGRVTDELDRTSDFGYKETQFRVEVLESLKGTLPPVVTINDDGSTVHNGSVWILEDAPVLPEIGNTYLFATRYYEEKDWHTVVSGGYGRIRVAGSRNLTDSEILDSKAAADLTARFNIAVENQITSWPAN